jgi:hypothetical protein
MIDMELEEISLELGEKLNDLKCELVAPYFNHKPLSFCDEPQLPCLELVKMWFREMHGIHVNIVLMHDDKWDYNLVSDWDEEELNNKTFDTYEDALDDALIECCNELLK